MFRVRRPAYLLNSYMYIEDPEVGAGGWGGVLLMLLLLPPILLLHVHRESRGGRCRLGWIDAAVAAAVNPAAFRSMQPAAIMRASAAQPSCEILNGYCIPAMAAGRGGVRASPSAIQQLSLRSYISSTYFIIPLFSISFHLCRRVRWWVRCASAGTCGSATTTCTWGGASLLPSTAASWLGSLS